MNRASILLAAVAVLASAAAVVAFVTRAPAASSSSVDAAKLAELERSLANERRQLDACRNNLDDLEEALNEARRGNAKQSSPSSTSAALRGGGVAPAREGVAAGDASAATTQGNNPPREPAARADDPRTTAWVDRLAGDLALSGRKKGELGEIARWAADERNALKAKADADDLDSDAVRAAIANEREEYEKRMKSLLSADEWLAFDARQGIERRPPTFARMPDILGDRAQPRQSSSSTKDAGE